MHGAVRFLLGVVACAGTAALLCVFLREEGDIKRVAPVICLQVVIAMSLLVGRLAGMIGSIVASLTFALFLFPPYGSLAIESPAERVILTSFQFISLGVALMARRRPRDTMAPAMSLNAWIRDFLNGG